MRLFNSFQALPAAISASEFSALPLSGSRGDFLAKAKDGGPVFLLKDSSPVNYSPAIELKHVSVQFHCTCRVTTSEGDVEDQFAVIECEAGAVELHEIFVRCIAAAVERLPANAGTLDLQRSLQALLELFRVLGRPSNREVTGLWAELFLIAKSKNVDRALQVWHANPFEQFDFSWANGRLEVKAAVSELRQHEFALEQLQSPSDGAGYVASVLLRSMTGGLGVVDLAREIEARAIAHPSLRQKLWENIAAALGNDFSARLDRRFDPSYAERSLAIYAMSDVPAPPPPSDPRVTAVRFRVDMSTVTSSLGKGARSFIDGLFGKAQDTSKG